jgi:hypothetical protein
VCVHCGLCSETLFQKNKRKELNKGMEEEEKKERKESSPPKQPKLKTTIKTTC